MIFESVRENLFSSFLVLTSRQSDTHADGAAHQVGRNIA